MFNSICVFSFLSANFFLYFFFRSFPFRFFKSNSFLQFTRTPPTTTPLFSSSVYMCSIGTENESESWAPRCSGSAGLIISTWTSEKSLFISTCWLGLPFTPYFCFIRASKYAVRSLDLAQSSDIDVLLKTWNTSQWLVTGL